jgi:hypothetical protein
MSEGPESAPPLMALVFGDRTSIKYEANLVSYFDPVIPQVFGEGSFYRRFGVHRHRLIKNITSSLASLVRKRVRAVN